MEDEQYVAIYGYFRVHNLSSWITKSKIFILCIDSEVAKITRFLKASCFTNVLANMLKLFY